jgi:hypothetical protein
LRRANDLPQPRQLSRSEASTRYRGADGAITSPAVTAHRAAPDGRRHEADREQFVLIGSSIADVLFPRIVDHDVLPVNTSSTTAGWNACPPPALPRVSATGSCSVRRYC